MAAKVHRDGKLAAILLYHRVIELPSDPQLLSVTPDHFREHLDIINELGEPISLSTLVRGLPTGDFPDRSVVVTFDDGYADNLTHASPLLAHASVPATVFVTTRDDADRREFWWDALEAVLLRPGSLPAELTLDIDGVQRSWMLDGDATWSEEVYDVHCKWNVLSAGTATPRQAMYLELCSLLRTQSANCQADVVDQLMRWASVTGPRPSHETMTTEQWLVLIRSGLIEVGGHTVTHPVLASLDSGDQRREITECRQTLSEVCGTSVSHFSYPFGTRRDYSADTVAFVREAGFASACANSGGPVRSSTSMFELPRYLVRDWSKDEFAKRLGAWLDG